MILLEVEPKAKWEQVLNYRNQGIWKKCIKESMSQNMMTVIRIESNAVSQWIKLHSCQYNDERPDWYLFHMLKTNLYSRVGSSFISIYFEQFQSQENIHRDLSSNTLMVKVTQWQKTHTTWWYFCGLFVCSALELRTVYRKAAASQFLIFDDIKWELPKACIYLTLY